MNPRKHSMASTVPPLKKRSATLDKNRLIALFPDLVYQRFLASSEHVFLGQGEAIYKAANHIDYVYFPTTCVISLICTLQNGATVEIGVVGNDGFVGLAQLTGSQISTSGAIVQVPGHSIRIKGGVLREEMLRDNSLQHVIMRYIQALITQISQTAVCNNQHYIEQRLCRWLLMTWDRLESNSFAMTHESIAHLLGVRRETVTHTAHHIQADGLIRYFRGNITLFDRLGLEKMACECYRVVKQEYDRLLNQEPDHVDGC